jgi:CheY-like chemotaxis protein
LLGRLRQASVYSLTPALAITAHAVPGGPRYFISRGFTGFIGKPFTREELLQTIHTALLVRSN